MSHQRLPPIPPPRLAQRKVVTPKEYKALVVMPIVKSMTPRDNGSMFRPMDADTRRAFARQEGIPFFARWIMFAQVRRYERELLAPFQQHCLATTTAPTA